MSEEIIRYVQSACEGNTDAMAKLFSGTLRVSYYLALKLSGDSISAVEITKKAYARAFCTITKLKKPEAFEIWMKQNVASVYKETQKFTFDDAEGGAPETSMEFLSENIFEDTGKASVAVAAVEALRPESRTVLVLHYFSGMPVASLSKLLGVSESTVNAVLAKAKDDIAAACESDAPVAVPVGTLPVLTRIFQREMASTAIAGEDVRDIFAYANDIYSSFKHTEAAKISAGDSEGTYFKAKAAAPAAEGPVIPAKPSVPSKPVSEMDDNESKIDFDAFVDEPVRKPVAKKKFDISKIKSIRIAGLNYKKLGLIAAALIILIIFICIIAHSCGNSSSGETSTTASSTDTVTASSLADVAEGDYEWVPGGFEDCTDIQYLDENCCVFRSATTGKYGLLDYQANVLLEPTYDEFLRCGYGRDYGTTGGMYHSLVVIDGEKRMVTVSNGTAVIAETPHTNHELTPQYLDKSVKYDERDRYFDGYAAAEKNGKWGYISQETDKKVIDYQYEAVNDLSNGQENYCDYCRPVTDGLVAVKKNGMMGIINMNNDTVVPFEYSDILVGDNGVFIAKKDGTWGVILVGSAKTTFPGVNITVTAATDDTDVSSFEDGESKTYICVADSGINIRSGAGSEYDDIGDLAAGDEVEGLGTKTAESGKEWLEIRTADGTTGYVALSYMQEQ